MAEACLFRQRVLTQGAALFEERHADKWLSDDRGNTALHPDDSKWAIEEWSPRVIVMYRDLGVEISIFDDPNEALAWLKSR